MSTLSRSLPFAEAVAFFLALSVFAFDHFLLHTVPRDYQTAVFFFAYFVVTLILAYVFHVWFLFNGGFSSARVVS